MDRAEQRLREYDAMTAGVAPLVAAAQSALEALTENRQELARTRLATAEQGALAALENLAAAIDDLDEARRRIAFALMGERVTMAAIAEAARISEPTLYRWKKAAKEQDHAPQGESLPLD